MTISTMIIEVQDIAALYFENGVQANPYAGSMFEKAYQNEFDRVEANANAEYTAYLDSRNLDADADRYEWENQYGES